MASGCVGESFFVGGVVGHCNRLPGEVLEFPSLELFKRRVDIGLGSVRLDLMVVKVFSNQNDSLIL